MLTGPLTADFVAGILGQHSITVLDVGARFGAGAAWWRMHPLAKLVGFEPAQDECERLRRSIPADRQEQYAPCGLGGQPGRVRLYRTTEPGCSSFYRPRAELIQRYPVLSCITLVDEQEIEVTTLDAWAEQSQTDDVRFLKLDTQGSELDILRGAERILSDCVGLEVEVEFSELYEGQPLFADVDRFLRERGFVLWRLGDLCHYAERTSDQITCQEDAYYGGRNTSIQAGNGRLFWGNAVYFRDYREFSPSAENVRRLLILACLLSARGDLTAAAGCVQQVVDWRAPGLLEISIHTLNEAANALRP